MKHQLQGLMAISIACLFFAGTDAVAQTPGPSAQTAADNARSGAIRTRNPGRMVQNGVARHQDFADRQSLGTVIDEPPSLDPFPGLIAEALDVVFGQINEAISAFRNLLLIRAGQTPIPTSAVNSNSNASGNSSSGNSSSGGRR